MASVLIGAQAQGPNREGQNPEGSINFDFEWGNSTRDRVPLLPSTLPPFDSMLTLAYVNQQIGTCHRPRDTGRSICGVARGNVTQARVYPTGVCHEGSACNRV